jgi:hypothetical protein
MHVRSEHAGELLRVWLSPYERADRRVSAAGVQDPPRHSIEVGHAVRHVYRDDCVLDAGSSQCGCDRGDAQRKRRVTRPDVVEAHEREPTQHIGC